MEYNEEFFDEYEEYIRQPEVRELHDDIFSMLSKNVPLYSVVDLGCGRSKEFYRFYRPNVYVSVDSNSGTKADIITDYRVDPYNTVKIASSLRKDVITGFVSLFSSEIHGTIQENYELYGKLFTYPAIQMGLVSGFYYKDKKDKAFIDSIGVHQTLESIEEVEHPTFRELRIIIPCISNFFEEEIEVWKLFTRRT